MRHNKKREQPNLITYISIGISQKKMGPKVNQVVEAYMPSDLRRKEYWFGTPKGRKEIQMEMEKQMFSTETFAEPGRDKGTSDSYLQSLLNIPHSLAG